MFIDANYKEIQKKNVQLNSDDGLAIQRSLLETASSLRTGCELARYQSYCHTIDIQTSRRASWQCIASRI